MRVLQRHTHSDRLARWLGDEQVESISRSMVGWYGPPIAIAGVPGAVYAAKGGDFVGPIDGGAFQNLRDFAEQRAKAATRRWLRNQRRTAHAGFGSLSDLISEGTNGKSRYFAWNKAGSTGAVQGANSLWRVGPVPAAAAAAAAAPGGTVHTSSTLGAHPYANPTGGDTLHFVRSEVTANVVNTLLMYDRIYAVAKNMNSLATEAVTGVPTRYQNTVAGTADSAEGNFLFFETGTQLANTAHNWTTCLYRNQADTGATMPSLVGVAQCVINRLDMPFMTFAAPLAAGDTGIKALTQMQLSAAVATGACDAVIGHPIVIMPIVLANTWSLIDGINSAFNLTRIFDNACLAFLELNKPATTATTYNVTVQAVAG